MHSSDVSYDLECDIFAAATSGKNRESTCPYSLKQQSCQAGQFFPIYLERLGNISFFLRILMEMVHFSPIRWSGRRVACRLSLTLKYSIRNILLSTGMTTICPKCILLTILEGMVWSCHLDQWSGVTPSSVFKIHSNNSPWTIWCREISDSDCINCKSHNPCSISLSPSYNYKSIEQM